MFNLVNIGLLLLWFFVVWIVVFVLHEYCHSWACRRYAGKSEIVIWFYKGLIPSMRCSCVGSMDYSFFLYAGGLLSGFISILFSFLFFCFFPPLFISLFIVGVVNVIYGLFEGGYREVLSDKDYMNIHYLIELLGLLVGLLLVRYVIVGWVMG